jgi:methionyl-tRNA formyltransferase
MVRAVYFGSSDSVFSNRHFRALVESGCNVAAVVDVPPARRASTNSARQAEESFMETARKAGIRCFEPANPNAPDFVREMQGLRPDLFVAVGYMLLLKSGLLAVPRVVAANFHASLLPAYRGKHPVFWALRNGEAWCGLTIHEMSAGLDTGDILFQVRVPTRQDDSVSILYDRIMTASVPLVPELVLAVASGNVRRTPQASDGASYHGATTEADFHLTWSMEAERLARWVTVTPGQCFVEICGKRFFLPGVLRLEAETPRVRPGTLLAVREDACRIAVSGGSVEIRRLRSADAGEMSARDALLGLGLGEGAELGEV